MTEIPARRRPSGLLACGAAAAVLAGCATAPRRPDVQMTPQGTLLTVGYDGDRTGSILEAEREAGRYCWNFEGGKQVLVIRETTIYQGRIDEQIAEAANIAGKVGEMIGSPEAVRGGRALSSADDYKTTVEFECR